ncbi:MAG: signal peptidase I, partial [Pseudomonadales bacterium]
MDIDMPFVLSWAVLVSGAIWLFDALILKPQRVAAATTLTSAGTREIDAERVAQEPIIVEYARSFFPILLLVLVLRSFLAEPYQIPSESMVPTLEVGDFVLVNKFAYGIRLPVIGTKIIDIGEPQRGDVMVFIPPHDPRYFIKRVIGIPGDVI